jgi:hypothetical protein
MESWAKMVQYKKKTQPGSITTFLFYLFLESYLASLSDILAPLTPKL